MFDLLVLMKNSDYFIRKLQNQRKIAQYKPYPIHLPQQKKCLFQNNNTIDVLNRNNPTKHSQKQSKLTSLKHLRKIHPLKGLRGHNHRQIGRTALRVSHINPPKIGHKKAQLRGVHRQSHDTEPGFL